MKICSSIALLILFSVVMQAQDIHYSNFLAAPVLSNPAGVGNFDNDWRITNIYRSQGSNFTEPFKTNLLGFDKNFRIHNQQLSGSIFYSNDMSANNTLNINQLYITGCYKTNITQKMILIFGLQANYIHKNSSFRQLTLPEQFDMTSGGFNNSLNNSENFAYLSSQNLQFASGAIWKWNFKNAVQDIGFAISNLNNSSEKFLNTTTFTSRKYSFNYLLNSVSNEIIIKKYYCFYTYKNKASELLFGTQLGYKIHELTKVSSSAYLGFNIRTGFLRSSDAMIFMAGIEYQTWNICFSYDYDISGLHNITSNTNALELSVVYTRPNTFVNKKNVPCEIY